MTGLRTHRSQEKKPGMATHLQRARVSVSVSMNPNIPWLILQQTQDSQSPDVHICLKIPVTSCHPLSLLQTSRSCPSGPL